jgi:hypothetical protein
MTTVVIMPGGFHPFHAGHLALYQSAQRAFPDAEVFVAATNDTSARPFPFAVKEKLAKLAGVDAGHFVQVKSPFQAEEITSRFDPARDKLIFVRSEKDAGQPPKPGGIKKDGNPTYLQPLLGAKRLEPFARHAYMAYLPTVEFGPGMTSATEIRGAWPQLNDQRKTALVMSLYPATQSNPKLAQTVVKLLDTAILSEAINPMTANTAGAGAGMTASYQSRENQPVAEVRVIDPARVDVFFRPNKRSLKKTVIAQNIPAKALDALINLLSKKYNVYPDDFEWGPSAQGPEPFGRQVESHVAGHVQQDPDYIEEKWSKKYKSSINCSNPKGFSQRAHCAGRKK